jgi:hypothetical protein
MARTLRIAWARAKKLSNGDRLMEKTYSQRVAGVFEGIGWILLIPTFLFMTYVAFMMLLGLLAGRPEALFFGLLFLALPGFGVVLLAGYVKHYDGNLNEKYVSALWIATAVYNSLLLLPWLLGAADILQSSHDFRYRENWIGIFFWVLMVFGYNAAIYFSLKAYCFERRTKLN